MEKITNITQNIKDILNSSKTKDECIRKLKEIDKKGGGTKWGDPGYMQKDVFNGLISVCLGTGPFMMAIGNSPLGIVGVPIGILGLYLTGVVFHLNATKYDKFHLLEKYNDKIKSKKKILEKLIKIEKDPVKKKELQAKINEANKCITAIDKERRKLLPPKEKEKISSSDDLDNFNFDFDDDWENWDDIEVDESAIIEEKYSEHLNPIYLIVSFTNTPMGKMIKAYTKDRFTHSCISLDPTLEKMISYNANNGINKKGGISFESLSNYIKYNTDSDIRVSVVFLKDNDYKKFKWNLEDYIAHYDITKYDMLDFLNIITNKTKKMTDEYAMICSQFVDHIFKLINIDITGIPSNLVTPGIISKVVNPKIYLIYDGKAIDYDPIIIEDKVNKLINDVAMPIKECNMNSIYLEPIIESKEFPIEFNKEGDLIIKKKGNIDFIAEHTKSKKLFNTYKKNKNYEAMEYEANKLWYMNILLEKRLEIEKNKNGLELYKIRAKILNEFHLYINELSKNNPSYNFETSFKKSPFSDASIKVTHYTLHYILQLLKIL